MTDHPPAGPGSEAEVLVAGAGPTGLALAAQLAAHGVRPRLIDRDADRARESRALAIQPRTLEVLADLGVTEQLVQRGNPAVRLRVHARGRVLTVPMFDLGLDDTAYPHLLFLSQAETERILEQHLTTAGITVERRVELVDLTPTPDTVIARLRHHDNGGEENVVASYVVGCDGAGSTVRRLAQIPFRGGSYPHTFVLADIEADGIEPDAAHVWLTGTGMLFFFPLVHPASWRMLVMRPPADPTPPQAPVELAEVQNVADAYTGGSVRLRDPVWMTNFRLHHRAATSYRAGRLFLAGDAAHIHSPAGAQGMNTGIQDAVNLAWKLAHAIHGDSRMDILDTYHRERAPIGAAVLRFTDRAFTIATATNPILRLARTRLAPAFLRVALRSRTGRRYAFRTISQLGVRYRHSPLSAEGHQPPRHGPHAGDRLPDAILTRDRQPTTLHKALAAPTWHLLLCGPPDAWPTGQLARLTSHHPDHLEVHRLTTQDTPGALHDPHRQALHRLGITTDHTAHYLMRPDGHIGYRNSGINLTGLDRYLHRWLPPPSGTTTSDTATR